MATARDLHSDEPSYDERRRACIGVIAIAHEDDPRIEAYRDIRERDLVGRKGMFIAEGEVVLQVLLRQSCHETVSILVAEARAQKLAGLLSDAPNGVPRYVAPLPVLERIAGFSMHRGILALGRRGPERPADALLAGLPKAATVLVLVGIANHDNMGGILRNAAAFGVDAVLLDHTSCDPLYRKAIRVSVGGALVVPFSRLPGDADPIALIHRHGFTPLALSPRGTTALNAVRCPPRTAIILGAEGSGLPETLLDRAQTIRIAMSEKLDSLNVATTSGIVLHHLRSGL